MLSIERRLRAFEGWPIWAYISLVAVAAAAVLTAAIAYYLLQDRVAQSTASQVEAAHLVGFGQLDLSTLPDQRVIALGDEYGSSFVVLDPKSQERLGEATASYQPWLALRNSGQQVLLSDWDGPQPRLQVFATALGQPIRQIALPDRIASSGYAPAMSLSTDQRYLFYEKLVQQCTEGGYAGACDTYSIGVIDLEAGLEVANASLPQNCGYVSLAPASQQDILALCPQTSALVQITPVGSSSVVAQFPIRGDASAAAPAPAVYPVVAGRDPGGGFFAVYVDGEVWYAGQANARLDLLPSDSRILLAETYNSSLGANRLVFAYGDFANQQIREIVIFDSSNSAAGPERVRLPEPVDHMAPFGGEWVALLSRSNGGISLLDLTTKSVSPNVIESAGAKWLVAR